MTIFSNFYDIVSDSDYILFDGTMIYEYWNQKDNWDTIFDVTYRNEENKEHGAILNRALPEYKLEGLPFEPICSV